MLASVSFHRASLHTRMSQTSKFTKDIGAIQKGADFVKAYALGFDVNVCYGKLVVVTLSINSVL